MNKIKFRNNKLTWFKCLKRLIFSIVIFKFKLKNVGKTIIEIKKALD